MSIKATTKNITSQENDPKIAEDKELILQCINVLLNENISYVARLVNDSNNLNSLQSSLEETLEDYNNGASNDDGFLELEATLLGVLLLVTGNESSEYDPHNLFSIALDEISYYEPDDQMCRELKCLEKYSKFGDPYYIEPHQLPISKEEWNSLPKKGKKGALVALCESRKFDKKEKRGTVVELETRLKEWSERQIRWNKDEIGEKNEKMYKILSDSFNR
jgi:hypothetical protein